MMKILFIPAESSTFIFLLLTSIATVTGSNSGNSSHSSSVNEDDKFFSQPMTSLQASASAPAITSSARTTDAFSYVLSWEPHALPSEIKCYKIRYRKVDDLSWIYKTVHANATQLSLNELDSSSLYVVEMIRLSRDDEISQLAMSSFRTGSSKKKPSSNNGKPTLNFPIPPQTGKKSNKSANARVPGAPSTPFVTKTSPTSVSLTWVPRSNGGSPITGYKVEMRVGKKKSKWKTNGSTLRADTKSYDVTGLKRNVSYKFRVIAINSIGESEPSKVAVRKAELNAGLRIPPLIRDVEISNGSVLIHWSYESAGSNKIQGFVINYSIGEKTKRRKIKDPLASTFEIPSLETEEYSVVIQAYIGKETTPESHPINFHVVRDHTEKRDKIIYSGSHGVNIPETHNPGNGNPGTRTIVPNHNNKVKKKSDQRDLAFIIGGVVLFCVIGVLLISCIFYHKQKKKGKRKRRSARVEKKPSTLCTKLFGSTCYQSEPEAPQVPPSPPRCSCYSGTSSPIRPNGSCLTSNRTSMSHNVAPDNGLVPCSRAPGNMYAVFYDYSPGRPPPPCLATPGVPLCWVRGDGEFCHIVPHNSRPKMIEEPNLSGTGSLRTGTSGSRTPASNSAPSRDPEVNPEEVHLMDKETEHSEET